MKFKLFFLGFLAFGCYADESVNDPEICNVVKSFLYCHGSASTKSPI